jgi:CRP-like cAMP-binding protein
MRYLTRGREQQLEAGQQIYAPGDPIGSDSVFIVISGSVKLVRHLEDKTSFVYVCQREETFGIVSTMAGSARQEAAIACEPTAVYTWSKEAFESAVSLYIELARLVIQNMSRYLRTVDRELAAVNRA